MASDTADETGQSERPDCDVTPAEDQSDLAVARLGRTTEEDLVPVWWVTGTVAAFTWWDVPCTTLPGISGNFWELLSDTTPAVLSANRSSALSYCTAFPLATKRPSDRLALATEAAIAAGAVAVAVAVAAAAAGAVAAVRAVVTVAPIAVVTEAGTVATATPEPVFS